MFLRHLIRLLSVDTQVKFYGNRLRRELNTRWVAEYGDSGPTERYIWETVQDRS